MYGVIYKLTNKINGKPYVGQTTRTPEERFIDHKHCKTSNIGRAIRKHGEKNFTIEVLEECETREQLNEREKFWIAFFNSKVPNGYNCTDGGESGWKIADALGGIPKSTAHREKLSAKKMGENNPNYGHPMNAEHKAKILASQPNRRVVICVETGEVFESMAAAARCKKTSNVQISFACRVPYRTANGFHWRFLDEVDDIAKIKIFPVQERKFQPHAVLCVETSMIFDSVGKAADYYKIDPSHVSRACRMGWASGGFHWRFADEPQIEIPSYKEKTKPRPVICVETGEAFKSIRAAARHYKINKILISKACGDSSRKAGGYHWMFKDVQPSDVPTESQTPAGASASKHPVICVETNEIFESITAAARSKNLRVTNISRACRNERNTAGGCHWRFVDEPTN